MRDYGITNFQPSSVAPTGGVAGDTWFDTGLKQAMVHDGLGWVPIRGSATDEVYIGTDDPISGSPTIELWYDTDATTGAAPGQMIAYAKSTTNVSAAAGTASATAMTLAVPALLTGRRYGFHHHGYYTFDSTSGYTIQLNDPSATAQGGYGRSNIGDVPTSGTAREFLADGICYIDGPFSAGNWTILMAKRGGATTGALVAAFATAPWNGWLAVFDMGIAI